MVQEPNFFGSWAEKGRPGQFRSWQPTKNNWKCFYNEAGCVRTIWRLGTLLAAFPCRRLCRGFRMQQKWHKEMPVRCLSEHTAARGPWSTDYRVHGPPLASVKARPLAVLVEAPVLGITRWWWPEGITTIIKCQVFFWALYLINSVNPQRNLLR